MLLAASPSRAQVAAWKPEKPVEIVVGASPGGGNDITARVMQKALQGAKLIENVQVTNRPGGSHVVAWTYMNQHAGDGHYVQIINEPLVTNKLSGVSAQDHNDFTPLARLFNEYVLFVAKPDSPFVDGKYAVDRMRKDPGAVVIGFGAARGNSAHLGIGMLARAIGTDVPKLKLVVFDSGSKSVTAAMGGHVSLTATVPAAARQHIIAGRLRGIAVTADKRLGGDFAQIPTWKELGVNAYYSSWRCLIGPKGMSPEQIAFWERTIARMSESDEWKTALANFVQEPAFQGSADLRRFLDAQAAEMRSTLVVLGMAK
jgi:putative tricarboxylic transport membrane protein